MVRGVIRELWPDRISDRRKDADFVIQDPIELLPFPNDLKFTARKAALVV
jgi:hypothetical protein